MRHPFATGICVALIMSCVAGAGAASGPPRERVATAGARSVIATLRPAIHEWSIPFGATRRREMAAYSLRHYGEDSYVLRQPKVIVEHFTDTATATEAYNTFAPDVPDAELHELPNTCAHFLVERSGRIDQLVSLSLRCRHTVGLNWTAIGIENVGFSDHEILTDRAQMRASLALTRWLRCTYAITLTNVIGHNESLSSPYHRERVASLQHQTHSDWNSADMHIYRTQLARLRCPVGSFGRVAGAATRPDTGGI
ncbi:MAG TPA: N-acetylmuramoyl-L-alanine amidase [Solirubrobacteraceae bacterium]